LAFFNPEIQGLEKKSGIAIPTGIKSTDQRPKRYWYEARYEEGDRYMDR